MTASMTHHAAVRRTVAAMTAECVRPAAAGEVSTASETLRATVRRRGESAGAKIAPTTAGRRVPPVAATIRAVVAAGSRRRTAAAGRRTICRSCVTAGIAVLRPSPGDDGVGRAGAAEHLNQLLPELAGIGIVQVDTGRTTGGSRPGTARLSGAAAEPSPTGSETAAASTSTETTTARTAEPARTGDATAKSTSATSATASTGASITTAAAATRTATAARTCRAGTTSATRPGTAATIVRPAAIILSTPIGRLWLVVGDPPGAVVPAGAAVPVGEAEEAPRPIRLHGRRPALIVARPRIVGPPRRGEPQGNAAAQT
jgi:hypothetical protein